MAERPAQPLVARIPLYGTGRRGFVREEDREIVAWAVVDELDLAFLRRFPWHRTNTGYAASWVGGRSNRQRLRMHRVILGMGVGDKRQVDHINRDRLDNRRSNLRVVERDADNKQNVPGRSGTSRHRGVSWDKKRRRWVAQARTGQRRLQRYFRTEGEAHLCVVAWRLEHMPCSSD